MNPKGVRCGRSHRAFDANGIARASIEPRTRRRYRRQPGQSFHGAPVPTMPLGACRWPAGRRISRAPLRTKIRPASRTGRSRQKHGELLQRAMQAHRAWCATRSASPRARHVLISEERDLAIERWRVPTEYREPLLRDRLRVRSRSRNLRGQRSPCVGKVEGFPRRTVVRGRTVANQLAPGARVRTPITVSHSVAFESVPELSVGSPAGNTALVRSHRRHPRTARQPARR
jgi:hypothetical protein